MRSMRNARSAPDVLLFVLVLAAALAHGQAADPGGLSPVDFRFGPPWWQTAICSPDDPDKVLVGKEGQVLCDFGGGGVRNFGICAQPEIVEGSKWIRQQTLSPKVPIVQTWSDADGVEVLEEAFMATPDQHPKKSPARLTRIDGQARLENWAKPARACAEEFSGVEVAYGGKEIQFQLLVPSGHKVTVCFGLCEGWHKEPGRRPLVLKAEGAQPRTVDPVKDFGPNQPGVYTLAAQDVDQDGIIHIGVGTPANADDRNAILNALWVFDGPAPEKEALLEGEAKPDATFPDGVLPERQVIILMTLTNQTRFAQTRVSALRLQTPGFARYNPDDGTLRVGSGTLIACSAFLKSDPFRGTNLLLRLSPVTLEPGASRQIVFTMDRHGHGTQRLNAKEAWRLREATRQWWERCDLPFDAIQVPDPGIQGMLESCVRNIWQAREIKNGQPAFHVGPTVYRGLWVVDGSFLLESATLLGRAQDARAGVEYLLSHQKPDGSFDLLGHYWKENGIVLWAATRHALLTQDKTWLRAHWPALQRVVHAIQALQAQASNDPKALEYRLLPPGTIDGGIGGSDKPEYSNTYWSLAGLKAAIAAAHWLGDESSAAAWQQDFDDFYATYRKAAARDTLTDKSGNKYIPTMMGNLDHHVPARGQWAFCHAVYPGQVFARQEPLVESQLAMLGATKVEGMVFDTGWMQEGIWTYFASFYGHALLWEGHGRAAANVLYAFAQHACPTRVWREEQKPLGKGTQEVGDMPHNWASAEFIRLTAHLLELDRGNALHLLEGFPREWAGPGMVTRLNGVLTPFGPLHLEIRVAADGKSARVRMSKLSSDNAAKVVLHLAGLTGKEEAVELPIDRNVDQRFDLAR